MCGNTTPPHHHRGAAFSVESSLLGGLDNVRCAPESDRIADIVEGPSRARRRHVICPEALATGYPRSAPLGSQGTPSREAFAAGQ